MRNVPIQTGLAIATLGVLVAFVNPPNASQLRALTEFTPTLTPLSPMARHVDAAAPAPLRIPAIGKKTEIAEPLLDDREGVLDAFYSALRKPGGISRVVHYGDSPTTADLITGDIRGILQSRFGDAGHGFILPAKPWSWYQHTGVR